MIKLKDSTELHATDTECSAFEWVCGEIGCANSLHIRFATESRKGWNDSVLLAILKERARHRGDANLVEFLGRAIDHVDTPVVKKTRKAPKPPRDV